MGADWVGFPPHSPVERDGFEPSVPLGETSIFETPLFGGGSATGAPAKLLVIADVGHALGLERSRRDTAESRQPCSFGPNSRRHLVIHPIRQDAAEAAFGAVWPTLGLVRVLRYS